jgi:outer membrane murein-binding lipoprotein Lpp
MLRYRLIPKPTRMTLYVDADIPEMLATLAGGQQNIGQYLSILIRSIHAGEREVARQGAPAAGRVRDLSLKVEEMAAQLAQLREEMHSVRDLSQKVEEMAAQLAQLREEMHRNDGQRNDAPGPFAMRRPPNEDEGIVDEDDELGQS